ncbi:MAG: S1 family peptidase [Arthrobacter sp.]
MTAARLRRLLAAGAAAGVLAASGFAGAAWGSDTPDVAGQSADASLADSTGSGLSEPALEEAVARDLGLTPGEFAAAGDLGTQAAEVAAKLRDIPGYVGIRLKDGQVLVSGSGDELLTEVAVLSRTVPALAVENPARVRQAEASSGTSDRPGSELAVSTEQLFQAYVREVGTDGLQAVVSSGGKFVIRTGVVNSPESTADPASGGTTPAAGPAGIGAAPSTATTGAGKKSPAEFVSRYGNVELDGGAPLAPEADVPGGVGYIADTGSICSTGFSAFDPAGLPAVLTAGHCASDGAAQKADLEFQFNGLGLLGKFGFSQFGGPGNSWVLDPNTSVNPDNTAVTDPGNVGTDIAVIGSLRPDVDPLPAASTWGEPTQPGPDVKIIGTADPVVGMPVCRSGRTSAWSCGTIDAVGIFIVPGPTYVEPGPESDPTKPLDLRAFRGFMSYGVQSSGGDSGGPYVSGNYAVGTHAAGDTPVNGNVIQNFAVAATLTKSLAVLPGYQLELFLNKPVVTSPAAGATYEPGQVISGNLPAAPASAVAAGSKVRITIQEEDPFEATVDGNGTWSFTAPESGGTLRFTAETVNGFSTSGAGSFEFQEAAPAEPAPPVQVPVEPPPALAAIPADPVPAVQAQPVPPAPAEDPAAVVVLPPVNVPADLANTSGRRSDGGDSGNLAFTGATALVPAALAAAAAIVVGGVLMVLVRRRQRTRG